MKPENDNETSHIMHRMHIFCAVLFRFTSRVSDFWSQASWDEVRNDVRLLCIHNDMIYQEPLGSLLTCANSDFYDLKSSSSSTVVSVVNQMKDSDVPASAPSIWVVSPLGAAAPSPSAAVHSGDIRSFLLDLNVSWFMCCTATY